MRQAKNADAIWICQDDGEQFALKNETLQSKIATNDTEWFADVYASILSKIEVLGSAYVKNEQVGSSPSPNDYINAEIDWPAIQRTCDQIDQLPLEAKESMFASLKTFQVVSVEAGI